MKTTDKISILCYLFNLLNGIFLILGLILLGCGLWMLYDQNNIFTALVSTDAKDAQAIAISYALIAVGAAVFLISLLGFLGSANEIRFLLIVYMVVMILICVGQVILQLVLFFQQGQIVNVLNSKFDEVITQYGNTSFLHKEHEWNLLDTIQKSVQCCGKNNASDWERNPNAETQQSLPCSCTNSSQEIGLCKISDYKIYSEGCGSKIVSWFSENIYVINGIGAGAIVAQIFQFALAIMLFKTIGRKAQVHEKS